VLTQWCTHHRGTSRLHSRRSLWQHRPAGSASGRTRSVADATGCSLLKQAAQGEGQDHAADTAAADRDPAPASGNDSHVPGVPIPAHSSEIALAAYRSARPPRGPPAPPRGPPDSRTVARRQPTSPRGPAQQTSCDPPKKMPISCSCRKTRAGSHTLPPPDLIARALPVSTHPGVESGHRCSEPRSGR